MSKKKKKTQYGPLYCSLRIVPCINTIIITMFCSIFLPRVGMRPSPPVHLNAHLHFTHYSHLKITATEGHFSSVHMCSCNFTKVL